jgi:threonyl-tRNA synthetase
MSGPTIQITLPDGTRKTVQSGVTAAQVLGTSSNREVLAVKINGVARDLSTVLTADAVLEPLTFDSPEGRDVYRHTSAHIMAQAVKELFPAAQLTIGPVIEEGFYYDFAFERPFTPEDLAQIEARAYDIIKRDLPITRLEVSRVEAVKLSRDRGERYKVEIIETMIPDPVISLYQQGDFIDVCEGPHLPSTGYVGAFKVLSSAGAYWRGDERNPMLQRIYGTSFPTQEELQSHLKKMEEIRRRDHRRLGKELDLITIQDEIGPGLVLWHPKGALVRLLIENFWREQHLKAGYQLVYSPHVARLELWKTSGHVEYYRDNMFAPIRVENSEYQLKPMNCPFHIMIYKTHLRSYRDLPLRYAELGTVYRYERTGVLHGLLRVRGFTQDDAHLFCRPDQIESEVGQVLDFTFGMLRAFDFAEFDVYVSTRPEKAVGSVENWAQAIGALEKALNQRGVAYRIDPGEGVFYGPKIDIKIKDGLGRLWQCSTIQVDFNNPQRFELAYTGEDGKAHRPIMIHRAVLGSLERFFGILLEHYAGAFPLWLAPVQVLVLPIALKHQAYAERVTGELRQAGFRVECDLRNETIGFKIREGEKAKVPFMLVIGDREMQTGTVSVRGRSKVDLGSMTLSAVLDVLRKDAVPPASRSSTRYQEV